MSSTAILIHHYGIFIKRLDRWLVEFSSGKNFSATSLAIAEAQLREFSLNDSDNAEVREFEPPAICEVIDTQ